MAAHCQERMKLTAFQNRSWNSAISVQALPPTSCACGSGTIHPASHIAVQLRAWHETCGLLMHRCTCVTYRQNGVGLPATGRPSYETRRLEINKQWYGQLHVFFSE